MDERNKNVELSSLDKNHKVEMDESNEAKEIF